MNATKTTDGLVDFHAKEKKAAEERERWLASLKPGDEVAADVGNMQTRWARGVVVKRTPTGRLDVKLLGFPSPMTFKPDGREHRARGKWDAPCRLEPLTQDKLDEIERVSLVGKVAGVQWGHLSLKALRDVARIVEHDAKTRGASHG